MTDDDIHDMMDRAHYAEIREQRLRIEVDRLKAENERLRDALVNLLDNSPVEYDFHGKYLDKEQGKAIEAARALLAALSPQEKVDE